MTHIEYEGIRPNLDQLAPSDQAAIVREVEVNAEAGMRLPVLSVIAEGVDVMEQPELWPVVHRDCRRPGRLELIG